MAPESAIKNFKRRRPPKVLHNCDVYEPHWQPAWQDDTTGRVVALVTNCSHIGYKTNKRDSMPGTGNLPNHISISKVIIIGG